MRWPFGRRSTPTDEASAPGIGTVTPPVPARPHDAWRSLPAVQRTIGRPPVVAPAAPFAERLATRQSPNLALAPLGHEVSPLASPGLLIGLVTTTDAVNTGRVDLPVQRHAPEGRGVEAESPGWSQFDDVRHDPGSAPGLALGPGASPPASGASPVGGGGSMIPAAITAVVQRLAAPAPILTASGLTSIAPPPAGTLDLRPLPAGASTPAVLPTVAVAQRSATGPAAAAASAADPAPPIRRPTLGQARRLGLGAPLAVGPDGSVQRLAAIDFTSPGIGPAGGPGGDPRPADDRPGSALPISAKPAMAAAGTPAAAVPAAGPASTSIGASAQLTVVRPLSIQRLAAGRAAAPGPRQPVVERGSDRTTAPAPDPDSTVQRIAISGTEPGAGGRPWAGLGSDIAADPQPASAGPVGVVAEPVGRTPIRASSSGSLLDPPPPASRASAATTVAREPGVAPQPVVARTIGDPLRSSPTVMPAAAFGTGPSTGAQREPVGPVVPRSPAGGPLAADQLPPASTPGWTAGAPAVQRAVEVRELVVTTQVDNRGPAGDPAAGAAPGSSTSPAASGTPASIADRDRELDELARRLYGRIRTRLAAELLADRERAGLLVDLR